MNRLLFISLCALVGCDLGPAPPPRWDEVAIQERGVARVLFGEARAKTLRALGEPDTQTLADGVATWYTLWYQSGALDGFKIYYREDRDTTADAYPADYFVMYAPFLGKTEKGIGIGSTQEEFFEQYGRPVLSDSIRLKANPGLDTTRITYYNHLTCLGSREFGLTVTADTVFSMMIGYHLEHSRLRLKCPEGIPL